MFIRKQLRFMAVVPNKEVFFLLITHNTTHFVTAVENGLYILDNNLILITEFLFKQVLGFNNNIVIFK